MRRGTRGNDTVEDAKFNAPFRTERAQRFKAQQWARFGVRRRKGFQTKQIDINGTSHCC